MLCPLETFPCVFKEIGQGVHTGQSREMWTNWGGYIASCAILFENGLETGVHIFVLDIHTQQTQICLKNIL